MRKKEGRYALSQLNIDFMMNMTREYLSGEMDLLITAWTFHMSLKNDAKRCIEKMMITVN
jgi:hypothetical protein